MIKKIFKILFSVVAAILLLVMLFVFLVAAGVFNNAIAGFIEKQASKNLNGELVIGSIEGRLVSAFTIRNIRFIHEAETILYGDEIVIDYQLRGLLKKQVDISLAGIKGFRVHLEQDKDTVWNFTTLIKPSDEEKDTTAGSSDWKVFVRELSIEDLSADIVTIDTGSLIPGHADIDLTLDASLDGDTIRARVRSFRLATVDPDFLIRDFRGEFEKSGEILSWISVRLELENSLLASDGIFDIGESGRADASLDFSPLDLADLRMIVPDLPVNGSPDISMSVDGDAGRYNFTLNIKEDNQSVDITGLLASLHQEPEYSADIVAGNIDIAHWLPDQKLKTDISAEIGLTGKGFNIKENDIDLSGSFTGLSYETYTSELVNLTVSKKKDKATGTVNAATFIGNADLKFYIESLFGKPSYDVFLNYAEVDLSKIVDSVETSFNGTLHVKGSGTSKEELQAEISFRSDSSEIFADQIGEFGISGFYNKGEYSFTAREIVTPFFRLDAEGAGNLKTTHSIDFEFEPLRYDTILAFMKLPQFAVDGIISGNVSGDADDLIVKARANLQDIFYDSIMVADVDAEIEAVLSGGKYTAQLDMQADSISIGSLFVRSAGVRGSIADSLVKTDLDIIYNDSLRADFSGSVYGFSDPVITINDLGVIYNKTEWRSGHDSASIALNETGITVNSFSLSSGDQELYADGNFSFNGNEDFELSLRALNLEKLPLYLFLPYEISGIVNSRLALNGTAEKPVIEGFLDADEIDINGFRIDSIRSVADYRDNLFSYSAIANPEDYEPVELMANIPVSVSLKDSIMVLKDDKRFVASVKFDSLDLEKIFSMAKLENTSVKGYSGADIKLGNTISKPDISGLIRISDGAVENTVYGADYRNIQFTGKIDSSRITISKLSASTGKGDLNIDGFLGLTNTDSLGLNDILLNIKASDFQALESGSLELNFDSDIKLNGTVGQPEFGGKLTINSSKINVDYFTARMSEKTDDPDPPLLLEALRDTIEVTAAADSSSLPSFSGNTFYKNLKGEVVADIPGNTWVSGKDMNFEIEGTLRGVKSGEAMNLFGDLNVKRGYYKLYGRTFNFEKGEIHFTGGDFNPDVDFEIVYRFRDIEKELKELTLLVTGKIMQPRLAFTLDEERLEEKDAISYIIFGKSVSQLGEGERSKISGEKLAMGAAVTQLSSALKGVLQETAGVDVFEVTGGENWKSGSVTIGKYITNNLFVSYDRSFDFDKQTKTADTEKIMLEYQFLRNLVLKVTNQEINSGFDLIFKKVWK